MDDIGVLSEKINEHENNIKQIILEADNIKKDFLFQIEFFIKKWYEDTIKNEVITNAKNTKELGTEKLKSLKEELNILIDKAHSLVNLHLSNNDIWKHENIDVINGNLDKMTLTYKLDDKFRGEINELLGYCGDLLVKYNYENTFYGDWRKDNNSKKIEYVGGYALSMEVNKLIVQYEDVLNNLSDEVYELRNAKRSKEQAEAFNLWNNA